MDYHLEITIYNELADECAKYERAARIALMKFFKAKKEREELVDQLDFIRKKLNETKLLLESTSRKVKFLQQRGNSN